MACEWSADAAFAVLVCVRVARLPHCELVFVAVREYVEKYGRPDETKKTGDDDDDDDDGSRASDDAAWSDDDGESQMSEDEVDE
eukprot:1175393-Prorocentrum_minimum.AAC.1